MGNRTRLIYRACVFPLMMMMTGTVTASAQNHDIGAPASSADITLTTQLVKTGLYLISGSTGNSLLRFSANGLILVDGQRSGNYRPLMSQVRKTNKLSDLPLRFLIITDHHEDHTGADAQFQAAGVGIVAHEAVGQHLTASNPSGVNVTLPTLTYAREQTLRLGGIEARLLHFGNAHTNADTVVYFGNLRVVAVGDLLSPTPDPDFAAGGSLVGWSPVLAEILKLDFDTVVPGRGPMATRADLESFKTKLDKLVLRARELVKKGVGKDQLIAQLKTDDLGWHLNFTKGQIEAFYAELSVIDKQHAHVD